MHWVLKRDGRKQKYNPSKVYVVVLKCLDSCPTSEDPVGIATQIRDNITHFVEESTELVSVETIQDAIELMLMELGLCDQAKHYILYRAHRSDLRKKRLKSDSTALSDYIHPAKYARFIKEKSRRELFHETVTRTKDMHLRRYPQAADIIEKAFDFVYSKRVLPSMRMLQFGGQAVEKIELRGYNCSFSLFDRIRFPQEAMYLLLCGCGVGYSVQHKHVAKLPALGRITKESPVVHHTVQDSIEGWADAVGALLDSYVNSYYVEFNYSSIRDRGLPLKTSGGRAPGHRGLKEALEKARTRVLDQAQGRKLRPIECHRLMCLLAEAVLSGGVRRSSLICLFSPDDDEMLLCKTGEWWKDFPEYANSNNSAVLLRNTATKDTFEKILQHTMQWGEPGLFFTNNEDYGTNPCAEVGMYPVFEGETGFSFCNLCEINAASFETEQDFLDCAWAAAVLGTLQAGYTDAGYLGKVTEQIMKRDALLGIGITGMMESPEIAFNPELQRKAAQVVLKTNEEVAKLIGINKAARATCVKPSGTSTLELGICASGIHPAHAKRYIRRVTANPTEVVFQYFKSINPHMCIKKENGDWLIEFPVEPKQGSICKPDLSATDFLEHVLNTQKNWVIPGSTGYPQDLTHNVSNTVYVRPDEWEQVLNFLWEHRYELAGASLLSYTGDKDYRYAPMEAVVTEADETHWNTLIQNYTKVDYTKMIESEDDTNPSAEVACVGGACIL